MSKISISKIKTKDDLYLEGFYVNPRYKKKSVAIIWLHGLGSSFYQGQDLMKKLTRELVKNGIGYFKFNTRGHDVISGFEAPYHGSAFENFEDSILDIRAIIKFAKRFGYSKFLLVGHSTGANKAVYYQYKTKDKRVKGLVLLAPVSDVVVGEKTFGQEKIKEGLRIANRLVKTDPYQLMPTEYGIWSAKRFLSLYEAGKSEDVFPYYNDKAEWKELKSVKIPLMVVFGTRDEFINRRAKDLIEIFKENALQAKLFSGVEVKDAIHGFQGREKRITEIILKWINTQDL